MVDAKENASGKPVRSRHKALWGAVAVVAIVAGGMAAYKITLEKTITERITARGATVASVSADFFGKVHLRDVKLPTKNGVTVTISAIDGRPKVLFLEGEIKAENIAVDFAGVTLTIPRASIEDNNLDRQAFADVFGSKSDLSIAERISRFSAKRVAIPEVRMVQDLKTINQEVVYKDLVLDNIANGRIANYSASGATFAVEVDLPGEAGIPTPEKLNGTFGTMTGQDIDAAYLARFYTEKAGPDDKDPRQVYGPVNVKDIVFSDGKSMQYKYNEIRSNGFSIRMLPEPFTEILKGIQDVTNPEDLPPKERAVFIERFLSLVDVIGKGDTEMLGISFQMEPKDGEKAEGNIDNILIKFDNRRMDMGLKNLRVTSGTGHVNLGEFSFEGFSWAPTMEGARKLAAVDDDQIASFPFTTLLPEFGTLRLRNIDVDVPDTTANSDDDLDTEGDSDAAVQAKAPERVKLSAKGYEIALTKPVNGIPSAIRLVTDSLALQVPKDSNDQTFQILQRLGYDNVVFSSTVDAAWNEQDLTLAINDISLQGENMGSVSATGLIGGVGKDFFSGDKVLTQVAALGLTAREFNLRLVDQGAVGKLIKMYADEEGVSEDELRASLATMASMTLQGLVGDLPKLQDVVTAAARFLAKPGTFELSLKARSPKGLGMFDFMTAAQNPAGLLEKIDIDVKAN